MSYQEHQQASAAQFAACAVITLSDTRTLEQDAGGAALIAQLTAAGHAIAERRLIRDEPALLDSLLDELLARPDIDCILTTGGTGISRRDATVEVIQKRLQQPIPGFGELFRMLSYQQIGSGALLSRATAGIASGKLLFALPGSAKAVDLAMTRLIVPELKHLLHELRK